MRWAAPLLVLLLLVPAPRAGAAEGWTCWSEGGDDSSLSTGGAVTRCRIGGSGVRDYHRAAGDSPPVALRPMIGADADGSCWYWTSRPSGYLILGVEEDGRAIIGYDPDGRTGGPIVVDGVERSCRSEPTASSDEATAYELLASYRHPRPDPVVDPPPGRGVTGMATFVSLALPEEWAASLTSPVTGRTIDVTTRVGAVEIGWGDGTVTVVPAELAPLLTGHPDGIEPHVYEVKTGEQPYPLRVDFVWSARYRVDGGGWLPLPVPPTSTVLDYPVSEILGVVTEVG